MPTVSDFRVIRARSLSYLRCGCFPLVLGTFRPHGNRVWGCLARCSGLYTYGFECRGVPPTHVVQFRGGILAKDLFIFIIDLFYAQLFVLCGY